MNKKKLYIQLILLVLVLGVSVYEIVVLSINLKINLDNNISIISYLVGVILFSIIGLLSIGVILGIIIKRKLKEKYYRLKK